MGIFHSLWTPLFVLLLTLTASFSASADVNYEGMESESTVGFSERGFPTSEIKNITKGHMQVGGGASLNYGTPNTTLLAVYPSFEYFFIDHLSFGASLNYSASRNYENTGLGPSGTWYFGQHEQWAFFVTQGLSFVTVKMKDPDKPAETLTSSSGTTGIGASHFFSPSISFGLGFYAHYYSNPDVDATTNFLGQFQIYF